MLEQGIDPSNVGTGEVENIEHEAPEETVMIESHDETIAGSHSYANRPLANGILKPKEEEKPKVFGGLDLYDPEAEV